MCDPVSIGIIAITVAAGAMEAVGQVRQGQAINAQSKYEAKVADRNAKISEQGRADAARRGEREQLNHWRRVSQAMGQQRAEFAAGGLDVNFGTPADVVSDTMLIGEEDSSIIASNTKKEMEGYDLEIANYHDSATAARMRGKAAKSAGKLAAVGTILGTVAKAGSMGQSSFGGGGGGASYAPSGSSGSFTGPRY